MDALRLIANSMTVELCEALGGPHKIETFGKGSIVGVMCELEYAAMWHTPGGAAVRLALGEAKAQVPAAKKVAILVPRSALPCTMSMRRWCAVTMTLCRSAYPMALTPYKTVACVRDVNWRPHPCPTWRFDQERG